MRVMLKWLPLSPTSPLNVVAQLHQYVVYPLLTTVLIPKSPRHLQYNTNTHRIITQFISI